MHGWTPSRLFVGYTDEEQRMLISRQMRALSCHCGVALIWHRKYADITVVVSFSVAHIDNMCKSPDMLVMNAI